MAGQSWPIIIRPGATPTSPATFTPDIPGGQPGQTLAVENYDIVFWNNQTQVPHQIAINGPQPYTTEEFASGTSSSGYVINGVPVGTTLTYKCVLHSSEEGTIVVTA